MTAQSLRPQYDDMVGQVVLGRYQIVRRLAMGGMGIVYLARARGAAGFAKPVVIKRIVPDLAANQEFAGMFIREAQILSHMQNPAIVNVIDFAEESGEYLMVLEYVHGFQLRQWYRYLRSTAQQIPTAVVLHIIINMLEALHYAHNLKNPKGEPMQIVHRDISPSNILISTEGRCKLVDFGIARMKSAGQAYTTQSRSFKGKLSYTAPEIFQEGRASIKSEVYACGVVLHEILIGINDFRGADDLDTFDKIRNHLPRSVHSFRDDVPYDIDIVIGKALAKSPQERYQSAKEFSVALRELQVVDERDVIEELKSLIHRDFTNDMASFLKVEPLQDLDRAWRNPSISPQMVVRRDTNIQAEESFSTTTSLEFQPIQIDDDIHDRAQTKIEATPMTQSAASLGTSVKRVRKKALWMGIPSFLVILPVVVFLSIPEQKKEERKFLLLQNPINIETLEKKIIKDPFFITTAQANKEVKKSHLDKNENKNSENALPSQPPAAPVTKGVQRKGLFRSSNKPDPDVQALTHAFQRHQQKVHDCFRDHFVGLQGKPKILVLFQVNSAGKVESSQLSPESLTLTELGKCVLSIANSTQFPRQKESLSFSIPVTAWRVEAETKQTEQGIQPSFDIN